MQFIEAADEMGELGGELVGQAAGHHEFHSCLPRVSGWRRRRFIPPRVGACRSESSRESFFQPAADCPGGMLCVAGRTCRFGSWVYGYWTRD
jgi:hypothetical protein